MEIMRATIAQGSSLSSAINCSGGNVTRIGIPVAFTAVSPIADQASVTFAVSEDDDQYHDLHMANGVEVEIIALHAGISVEALAPWGRNLSYIKIRSGTRHHPIVQVADCEFEICVAPPGP